MGRAFEYRKASKMARWDKMAKAFTKVGREIAMAVKLAGPNAESNPALRRAMQNAKAVSMPKDRVEAAIKRAVAKDSENFEELVYEGYGPFGIAIIVETATDNPTRTVANVRSIFNKYEGNLGTTGSLSFIFDRKGVFTVALKEGLDLEVIELDLIESGAEEIEIVDNEIIIITSFDDFGAMQSKLEGLALETVSSGLKRFPNNTKSLVEEQSNRLLSMIERFEEDDDVQNVYHNAELTT